MVGAVVVVVVPLMMAAAAAAAGDPIASLDDDSGGDADADAAEGTVDESVIDDEGDGDDAK